MLIVLRAVSVLDEAARSGSARRKVGGWFISCFHSPKGACGMLAMGICLWSWEGEGLALGCSVAPLHMAVGGWRGVRHLCFCLRSSHVTAVPCSPQLEEENLHQTKGCEGLRVYRQEAKLRCPLPTFHIHPVDASGRWGGRAPATRDTNTLWLRVCVCN